MIAGAMQFRMAAEAQGLRIDGPPEADGVLHRVPAGSDGGEGRAGRKSGWYVLHHGSSGLWGAFGVWQGPNKSSVGWRENGATITREDASDLRAQAEVARVVREREAATRAADTAEEVRALLGGPDVRAFHRGDRVRLEEEGPWGLDYLAAKGFDYAPSTVYLHRPTGRLLLPIRNASGQVVNLQRVWRSELGQGSWVKAFLPGGQVKGCWMVLPGVGNLGDGPIAIAEGYATAATMAQASGLWTLAALNAGNLGRAATAAREVWPRAEFVVVADDDWGTDGNPGLTKAAEAARMIGARVVVPDFSGLADGERERGETDLNDAAARFGLEAVKASVMAVMAAPAPTPPAAVADAAVDREAELLAALEPRAPWAVGERPTFQSRPVLVWCERRRASAKAPDTEAAGWNPAQAPRAPTREAVLHQGVSAMIAGSGGYGKTHLASRLAVAVATGGDWVQFAAEPDPEEPVSDTLTVDAEAAGAVLWVCAEEDAAEAGRRLWAACQRNADGSRASVAEVERRAKLVAERVRVLALADTAAEGEVLVRAVQTIDRDTGERFTRSRVERLFDRVKAALAEPCGGVPWRLVMLDPMVELVATGAESESDAMREALRAGVHPLRRGGATVLVLHHTRKGTVDQGKADPVDLVRGSSAIIGSMRWVGLLWKPPGTSAGTVTLEVVKSNYARPPRAAHLRWSSDGEAWLRPCTPAELEPPQKVKPQKAGKAKAEEADDDGPDDGAPDPMAGW